MFNKVLKFTQEKLNFLYENSLILQNVDRLIFVAIISVFLLSTVMSSDVLGFVALIAVVLTIFRVATTPDDKFEPNRFELWLLAYFMIVIISLAGSTLFALSLKGFIKTFTYMSFYVSIVHYLKNHRYHIPYVLGAIGVGVIFESIIGVMQNFARVDEISTWQDVSNLNPEQVMTRVYGTLLPLNPNLLGGYFVAGIPSLFGLVALFFADKKYEHGVIFSVLALLSVAVLFMTGCRGAYIGCMVIFLGIFLIGAKFLWHKYKKIFISIVASAFVLVSTAIISLSSLRARIGSIFAMRQDSSNSFRFNVYQSSIQMFKDNWLLGIGVGNKNFREIYGLYMRTGFDALSAYNIFLETAVESGIFALIAFLGFIIVMIKRGVSFILNSADIKEIIFVSAAVVSICAMMVHGLVDTVFFRPQIQFIFWAMVAIISAVLKNKNSNEV
ncbi:MAG: O-antigen ligase family protein [Candidatus Gastranaerophilaceae bacterium]|nr:O-antigen ligase family protein [Candidatus Gastranaerophilaceae bacterium]